MQGKSIMLTTPFIILTTAIILLSPAIINLVTAFIILSTAKIKLATAINILPTANIQLAPANIKRLTEKYNLVTAKIHLTGATTNRKQFATAQEKAHLQSATPNAKRKIAKELFPFPLLPTLKKRINFLHSNPKDQPCRTDGTAYNSSLQKWRVQCFSVSLVLVESSVIFSNFGANNPPLLQAAKRYRSV